MSDALVAVEKTVAIESVESVLMMDSASPSVSESVAISLDCTSLSAS
jgi:hypothetical protein